jgi:hypothetical protein
MQAQMAESPQMSFAYQVTQHSDLQGKKRKASCGQDPIYQQQDPPSRPSSRLKLLKVQQKM